MLVNDVTPERLRRLAHFDRPGKVLSVFVNLDPREFGTAPARATQVRSVIDRASRKVNDEHGLDHAQRVALRSDLSRVEEALVNGPDISGARALAVFASSPAGLFELLRLPAPVEHDPVIADSPYVEPVAALGDDERWAVLLANRRYARLLYGNAATLEEVDLVESNVHGQHDQGGWSQARYQRSVEQDVKDHLKAVGEVALRRLEHQLPDGLLLGCPEELTGELEQHLHPYLRERVVSRLSLDVENSSLEQVREAAGKVIDEVARKREDELLGRLKEGLSRGGGPEGRAVAGLADTLEALTEQRVEALLIDDGLAVPGVVCPRCGLLAVDAETCPADGTPTVRHEDIIPDAMDRAITQSARVVMLRDRPDLGPHEHIAAVLRF